MPEKMVLRHRINADGLLLSSHTENYPHFGSDWILIDTPLPLNYSPVTPAIWDFANLVWIVQNGDEEKAKRYEEQIITNYTYLMRRALSSSMGKEGGYEYLKELKSQYDKKYNVAIGTGDIFMKNSIIKEMDRDFPEATLDVVLNNYGIDVTEPVFSGVMANYGITANSPVNTHLDKMYVLICVRYLYAFERYQKFTAFAENFRTKCRTFVEFKEWSKLDISFEKAAIPTDISDNELDNLVTDFNSL